MDKGKIALGVLSLVLVGLAMGYVVATGFVMFRYGLSPSRFDVTLLAREYRGLSQSAPKDFLWVNLILGGFGLASLVLSVTLLGDALTRFGTTHWQTRSEMKRNGFFAKPGGGFLLGKLGSPNSKRPFLVSKTFPHALIVAPTGRGKGVGFVIPNLLTYKGSAVVLDVKGENFRETSRFRAIMGDKVFRFAPTDWDRPTHRYNPLARIAAMTNPDRQQMELKLTAKLFLQTDNEKLSGLLAGGIDLFVAAGLLAFERGVPTIGEIYRITASGGDKQKEYLKRSQEVKNKSAKLIFERMASTNNDTLTSYLSLLMTSGLDTWDNRAIDAATATSDFSFRDIRRRPHAIYLVVESEMIRPLAPLIRLFFSDLIASLQAQEPGDDEPWPVMIMLDEFDRLGKMPIVAESIKTLRSFGGNLAIVTQTIPALDEIYDEVPREACHAAGHGAGVWHTARRSASSTARTYISGCASPHGSLIGCSRTPRDVPASTTETRTRGNSRYRRVCLSRCRPSRRLAVLIRSTLPVAVCGVRLSVVGRSRGRRRGLVDPAWNQPVFGAAECSGRSHQLRFRLLESFIAALAAAFSGLLSS